jgi:hypothetical protein
VVGDGFDLLKADDKKVVVNHNPNAVSLGFAA